MPSNIDPTKPVPGSPTTQSMRDNFSAAKTEIEALQNGSVTLAGDIGGTVASPQIVGLRGRTVSTGTPAVNQSLIWNGSQWAPAALIDDLSASTTRTFSSDRIQALIGSPSISGITAMRSTWLPMIYRQPMQGANPFGGNFRATGVSYESYNGFLLVITDEPSTLWLAYEEAATNSFSSPGSFHEKLTIPINFVTAGYMGSCSYYFHQSTPPDGEYGTVLFTRNAQALQYYHDWDGNRHINAVNLNGLPGGFQITAMWAAQTWNGQYQPAFVYVICNNTLYRTVIDGKPAAGLTFTPVSIPAAANIDTMTRLYAVARAHPNNAHHYLLVWGTAPANRIALYDSMADSWTALTPPFDISGAANAAMVWSNGKVGAYKPTSPAAYYTCDTATDPDQWTQRFVGSPVTFPINRRLKLIGGVLCFMPIGNNGTNSVWGEAYTDTDLDQNLYFGPGPNWLGSGFQFPTEYVCVPPGSADNLLPTGAAGSGSYANCWAMRQTHIAIQADKQTFTAITDYSLNETSHMPFMPVPAVPVAELGPSNRRRIATQVAVDFPLQLIDPENNPPYRAISTSVALP